MVAVWIEDCTEAAGEDSLFWLSFFSQPYLYGRSIMNRGSHRHMKRLSPAMNILRLLDLSLDGKGLSQALPILSSIIT